MAAFDCKCRKHARCDRCMENDGRIKTAFDPFAPARGVINGTIISIIVWVLFFLVIFFGWHV